MTPRRRPVAWLSALALAVAASVVDGGCVTVLGIHDLPAPDCTRGASGCDLVTQNCCFDGLVQQKCTLLGDSTVCADRGDKPVLDACRVDDDCSSGPCISGLCTTYCAGDDDCAPLGASSCQLSNDQGAVVIRACACLDGTTACAGEVCADLHNDPQHCGRCGTSCENQICASGSCVDRCPADTTQCGGRCSDVLTSPIDCGRCDHRCSSGMICDQGLCGCESPGVLCSDGCQKCALAADTVNCGSLRQSECCPRDFTFCDKVGPQSGCLPPGSDCDTLTMCNGKWRVCEQGATPHCGSQAPFACCTHDFPQYCDVPGTGTCWAADIDCSTVATCAGTPRACPHGETLRCGVNQYACCDATNPTFCDVAGTPNACWPPGIDCSTLTNCSGHWLACVTGSHVVCPDSCVAD